MLSRTLNNTFAIFSEGLNFNEVLNPSFFVMPHEFVSTEGTSSDIIVSPTALDISGKSGDISGVWKESWKRMKNVLPEYRFKDIDHLITLIISRMDEIYYRTGDFVLFASPNEAEQWIEWKTFIEKSTDILLNAAKEALCKPINVVNERNQKILNLLEAWVAEPDDKGEEWWDEFEKEIKENRFNIRDDKEQ